MTLVDSTHFSERRAYLAHLRHELRTPINAILGYSEMLLEDAGAEVEEAERLSSAVKGEAAVPMGAKSGLNQIHAAGEKLLEGVNSLLDPARIETGEWDGDLQSFKTELDQQLNAHVHTILSLCKVALEEIERDGLAEMAPDLERICQAGRDFQALMNSLSITIENDGAEVSLLGEAIELEAGVKLAQELRPAPGGAPDGELPGRLLVVDDSEGNRDVLRRRVQREGHNVWVAENGRRALEMLAAQKFDLVLLDILMPEMNGYQVLQAIKSNPETRDIPVIMISALDEIDSVVRCIEMGAEDYLPKPFNPVLLKARIGACLEKKRLRDKEVEYLNQAARVTAAAAAVESNEFTPESLDEVAARPDELGQLARVFQRMAREVVAREARLRQEVEALRIQVDDTKKERQVAEITETDYFQQLQAKARRLRNRE